MKNVGVKGAWAYPAQSFKVPPIISGTGEAMNFKFCTGMHFHTIDYKKRPLTILGKVVVGVVRNSRKFSGHRAHCAVIFAIAWLSCSLLGYCTLAF